MEGAPRENGSPRRFYAALAFLVAAATALYSIRSVLRHRGFRSCGFDLGIFDQALWHIGRGEWPESTVRRVPVIFADHFHPTISLFAPIVRFGGVEELLIAQAAVVASAAIPVALFARRRLGDLGACLAAAWLLLGGSFLAGTWFDFHEVALAAPLGAWMLFFYDRERYRPMLVCAALLLLTKEDQGFTVGMLGLIALAQRRSRWLGGLAAALGWPFFVAKFIVPRLNPSGYSFWVYGELAPGPKGLVLLALREPWTVLRKLADHPLKVQLLVATAWPVGWLAVGSPYVLLAVPSFVLRLLSETPNNWSQAFHYGLAPAPLLMMATVDGFARLRSRLPEKAGKFAWGAFAVAGTLGVSFSVRQSGATGVESLLSGELTEYAQAGKPLEEALRIIPNDASVAATMTVVPHLTERSEAYDFYWSADVPPVEYVAVRDRDPYAAVAVQWMAVWGPYDRVGGAGDLSIYHRRGVEPSVYPAIKTRSFREFERYIETALEDVKPATPISSRLRDPNATIFARSAQITGEKARAR